MDGVVEESKKRRLPQWMLGVSGADQVKKSRKGGEIDVDKIEKKETDVECKVKKSRARRSAKCAKEVGDRCEGGLDDEESNVVVKRQRVTRKKKVVRQDVVSTISDAEEAVVEEKRKRIGGRKAVRELVIRRSEKRKSKGCESNEDIDVGCKGLECSEDIEAASPNEDDVDLNMDDLISIANEFVKDENKSKRNVGPKAVQKTVSRRRENGKGKKFERSEDIDDQSKNVESSDDIEAASPNEDDEDLNMDDLLNIANEVVKDEIDRGHQKKSDAEQTVQKQCAPTAISRNERADSVLASQTVEKSPVHEETASFHNLSSTGDPAQDMLDLLLGPLLTQPPKEEKKADIITDEMIIAHQLKKQNQIIHNNDAAIPLGKKKTSLKDKVAMLLD